MLPRTHILHPGADRPVDQPAIRNGALDGARFLAAVAVLWIHAGESAASQQMVSVCRIAVPFFTCSMIALGITSLARSQMRWAGFLGSRFRRLYMPFLAWSLVYLLLRCIKHQVLQGGSPVMLGWATFLTGTASHLWFLPFALLVSALICPLGRWLQERQMPGPLVVGMGVIVGVLVACTPCPVQVDATGNPVTYFFGMSWAALPSAMFGFALASLGTLISREAAFCAGLTGLLLLFVMPVRFDVPSFFQTLVHNLGGIVLWLLAQVPLPRSASTLFCSLGSLSFGIYLIHLGWVEAGQALFDRMGIEVSLARDLVVVVGSLVASVSCVIVGRRILWARPLL